MWYVLFLCWMSSQQTIYSSHCFTWCTRVIKKLCNEVPSMHQCGAVVFLQTWQRKVRTNEEGESACVVSNNNKRKPLLGKSGLAIWVMTSYHHVHHDLVAETHHHYYYAPPRVSLLVIFQLHLAIMPLTMVMTYPSNVGLDSSLSVYSQHSCLL